MIGMIKGQICHMKAPMVCVATANGVGYDVELPLSAYCRLSLNQEVVLWTFLIVREDAQILCGFLEKEDKEAFKKLIKINGVGMKMALAMLSNMSAADLSHCVETNNEAMLTRIPGVGKKTAQRLLIELKGKLNEFRDVQLMAYENDNSDDVAMVAEVESALINLGYKEKEAQNAIKIAMQSENYTQTQHLLRATLKQLSGF